MKRTVTYEVTDAEILEFADRQKFLPKAKVALEKARKALEKYEKFANSPERIAQIERYYERRRCTCGATTSPETQDAIKLHKLRQDRDIAEWGFARVNKVFVPDAIIADLREILEKGISK